MGGYLPTSFLDWEGHVAPVIFVSGCNFRCPWCHNGELVLFGTEPVSVSVILDDIKRRSKFLDGVVVTGGEPTLWEGLLPLLRKLGEMGLAVKLDTNGSNPGLLERILGEKLVKHVAMDVKAPFDDKILERVTGVKISAQTLKGSLEIIRKLAPSYELRTTWSPYILTGEELILLQKELDGDPNWVVQPFVPTGCLDPGCLCLPKVTLEEINSILPNVKKRGQA